MLTSSHTVCIALEVWKWKLVNFDENKSILCLFLEFTGVLCFTFILQVSSNLPSHSNAFNQKLWHFGNSLICAMPRFWLKINTNLIFRHLIHREYLEARENVLHTNGILVSYKYSQVSPRFFLQRQKSVWKLEIWTVVCSFINLSVLTNCSSTVSYLLFSHAFWILSNFDSFGK